jgi:hypothetical protein
VSIEVTNFQMSREGAQLGGSAMGRSPTDARGKEITPAPFTLVIEFVDVTGQVIDSKEAPVPVVAHGATHDIAVEAKGANLAGWRDRSK